MHSKRYYYLAIVITISLACNTIQNFNLPGGSASQGDKDRRLVFNEVLFLPGSGDSAFIELKAVQNRTELSGVYFLNESGERFDLPDEVPAISPGEYFLIIFDGEDQIQPGVLHADRLAYLSQESGYLDLLSAVGSRLDHVAWGPDQPDTVNLSRGGFISTLQPGTTIGRYPLSIKMDLMEWTVFSHSQATPGEANPQPGVEVMFPPNGAILSQPTFDLSWYPAVGAAEYHVQLAGEASFSTLIVDETVTRPELQVELQPGTYYWRVQAFAQDGIQADQSSVQRIIVDTAASSIGHSSSPRHASLPVPMILQHKDTAMLLLELNSEDGNHAWDAAHSGLDRSDPADNHNCAPASIAMINHYWAGDLSQDRIGFEIFRNRAPGPENDLVYSGGFRVSQVTLGLKFALGADPSLKPASASKETFWEAVKAEIDRDKPILAAEPGHVFVIVGYEETPAGRFVIINDPWVGSYELSIDDYLLDIYWLMPDARVPMSEEPELAIQLDSDGDGVLDFDETERFGTLPDDPDFDKDNLKDKDDVRGSIFDDVFGYAVTHDLLGRDYDGDGLNMELDVDSDGGGCFDGMEDYDYDGKYLEPETWNFEDGDDACITGTDEILLDENQIYDDGNHHQRLQTLITFSLRVIERGKLDGLAQIQYSHTGEFNYPECSGTHDIGLQYYQARLQGEFFKTPGQEGTFVSFQATPASGEPYIVQWNISCQGVSPPYEENKGWSWGGTNGQLVDGSYDYYLDMSDKITNGEFWQETHIEQGGFEP